MPAGFQEILLAFEFVASGGGLHQAFLCRRTGKIYWRSELSELDEFEDELPDDIEDEENYFAIPDKRELGLGKPLALDFAREFLPNDFDRVRYMFQQAWRLPEVSSPADAKKCPRSLVRFRIESHRTGIARMVRVQFDRSHRADSATRQVPITKLIAPPQIRWNARLPTEMARSERFELQC
jgi:hypothetical protein